MIKKRFLLSKLILAISLVVSMTGCAEEKAREVDRLMTYCYENGMFNGTPCQMLFAPASPTTAGTQL